VTSKLADAQARERIADDLDRNLGVEAAAGTGKTTVLVNRVVNLLASGKVAARELVVITFTEKAAAELSTRVRDALERRARQVAGAERERVLVAARELYGARIETIHGFATSLLRERPVEAGIDPLFEVLDDLSGRLHFERAYERFQDQLLSEPREELETALRRGFTLTELKESCKTVSEHRYLLPLADQQYDGLTVAGAVASFVDIADELEQMLQTHQPGEDAAVPLVEGIVEWSRELDGLDERERERRLVFAAKASTHLSRGRDANWGGEKERLKELQQEYRNLFDRARTDLRTAALLGLLPHIETFVRTNEVERKRDGVADYDDLLFWARDLVRDSAAARGYFRRTFNALLVDEFQDTDPVQAELALLLSSDEDPDGDWQSLSPSPGRLTVVGDPKQSIYRFRRADIALYEKVMSGPLDEGRERISTSFRTNPALLQVLNDSFNKILVAHEHVQPANVPLDAPPGAAEAQRPPVVVVDADLSDGSAEDVRREEARVLAGLICEAHDQQWQVRDRREGVWRDCRWGDVAVLVPARTGIELYEGALADAGIPYRHEGSRDFFQREEVRDLIWVLAAIDDPTDKLALVGALKSSAFAINDEQLVLHRANAGSLSYRHRPGDGSAVVEEALAQLHDLYRARSGLSLAELVRRVVERTRLVEFALTTSGGEQGAANLLAIAEDARLFSAAGGGGLRAFIRYLRESMAEEQIEIEATVAEETDDVVRIMTIHGAKGLEYPIVALANIGGKGRSDKPPVADEHGHLLHFRVGASTSPGRYEFATPRFGEVVEKEKALAEAERLRLLYVACTRARDFLLVPSIIGKEGMQGLLEALRPALPDDPRLVEVREAQTIQTQAVEESRARKPTKAAVAEMVKEREVWAAERDELRATAGVERAIERAVGPLAAEVSTFDAGLMLDEGPPIPVGDAVHMVMERVTLPDVSDLEQIAEDVCLEGDIADSLDEVIGMCRNCLAADSVRSAIAADQRWREVPFMSTRPTEGEAAESAPLASGRVDLVYGDGEELVVVDYKTDQGVSQRNAEAHTRRHHGGQAEVYAEALTSATSIPVREVVFVYARTGVEVKVDFSSSG
jgi:ATP-dependent helicase/nuclease subunit A